MKKIIKNIHDWVVYWADWEMIILGTLMGIIALCALVLIVVLILGACGIIPMTTDGDNNTLWLSLITISNALRMMR